MLSRRARCQCGWAGVPVRVGAAEWLPRVVAIATGWGCHRPRRPCYDRAVIDFGEPARTSHNSKKVLSIVKFGGPTRTELRTFRWEVRI